MGEDTWELDDRIERLEAEERELSTLRAKLHDRLASFANPETERKERELSDRRKALHDEIDRLRAQRETREQSS